jgi:hypothetical protein
MARPTEKHFSEEYVWATSMANPHWRFVRFLTFAVTLRRDVIFPWFKATDCDHLRYRNLGREWPLLDLVPLHRLTHMAVTALRAAGLTILINLVLRGAYLGWLAVWAVLLAEILHLSGVSPWNPLTEIPHLYRHAEDSISGSVALLKHVIAGG